MAGSIDPSRSFIRLCGGGGAEAVALTPAFWRESVAGDPDERWLGVFDFASSADLHASMQEMHPEADEVILLVSGAIDVVLEEDAGERVVPLDAGQAAIVPRGVWHRLRMREPGRLLFVNSRRGMQSRRARDGL